MIFLKYSSNAFRRGTPSLRCEDDADHEDQTMYEAANVSGSSDACPLVGAPKGPRSLTIGVSLNKAMEASKRRIR